MFKIFKSNEGVTPVIKEMPATAATYNVGDALAISSGKLAKVTGTAVPTFISCESGVKTSTDVLAVNPVYEGFEYLTTLAATGTSLVIGNKVTIHTDSAQVTATTTSGVAEIVEILGGGEEGSEVIVKF